MKSVAASLILITSVGCRPVVVSESFENRKSFRRSAFHRGTARRISRLKGPPDRIGELVGLLAHGQRDRRRVKRFCGKETEDDRGQGVVKIRQSKVAPQHGLRGQHTQILTVDAKLAFLQPW